MGGEGGRSVEWLELHILHWATYNLLQILVHNDTDAACHKVKEKLPTRASNPRGRKACLSSFLNENHAENI